MSVSLVKGGSVSVTRAGADTGRVLVGLGWHAPDVDLDASALLLDADGRVPSDDHLVFFNNPSSPEGAVTHLGDERRGGDDVETIAVDLALVPAEVDRIVFVVSVYGTEQSLAAVGWAHIRVSTEAGGETARYDLDDAHTHARAAVVGELYRRGSEWKFRAGGITSTDGLADVVAGFGVRVAEA